MNQTGKFLKVTMSAGLLCSSFITSAAMDKDAHLVAPELWAGPYYGIHFGSGGGRVNSNLTSDTTSVSQTMLSGFVGGVVSFVTTTTTTGTTNLSGKLYGNVTGSLADLFIGYNIHRMNARFLYGAQLEGTVFSDIASKSIGTGYASNATRVTRGSTNSTTVSTASTATKTTSISQSSNDLTSMITFVGRAGLLVRPDILCYAVGGPTEGNFLTPNNVEGTGSPRNQWVLGYTAGGGTEYKFNEHWSITGEYRFLYFHLKRSWENPQTTSVTQYSPSQDSASIGPITNSNSVLSLQSNFNFNLGKIGIIYRT